MMYGGLPAIAISITLGPGVALLSRIACRNEPGPESLEFVTVKTAPNAEEMRRDTTRRMAATLGRYERNISILLLRVVRRVESSAAPAALEAAALFLRV